MMSAREATITRALLEEVLRDRKAEKKRVAEKKRKEDLKKIQIRNAKNGLGRDPLQLFPQEIWDMILDLVVDPSDLESFRNSCTHFHEILEERRLRDILFPLVFHVEYLQNLLEIYPGVYNEETNEFTLKPLRTLRLVCKKWRDNVDNRVICEILKDNISRPLGSYDCTRLIYFDFPPDERRRLETEGGSRTPEKLLEDYNPHDQKRALRFPTRALEIEFRKRDEEGQVTMEQLIKFIESISQALEYVGNQISYFRFAEQENLQDYGFTSPQIYELLQKWISFMPNVKWVELELFPSERNPETGKSSYLNDIALATPFPRLGELNTLAFFQNRSPENARIAEALIRSNHHVREFIIDVNNFDFSMTSDESRELIHQIRTLQLESASIRAEKTSLNPMVRVYALTNFQWPLKAIKMDFHEGSLCIDHVFQYLNRFKTLELVDLTLYKIQNLQEGEEILNLPNLKCFGMRFKIKGLCHTQRCAGDQFVVVDPSKVPGFFCSIDYLLNCPKLETLRWDSTSNVDPTKLKTFPEIIQFQYGFIDLHKSNIWNVFPSLKTVEVGKVEESDDENYSGTYVILIYRRGETQAERLTV